MISHFMEILRHGLALYLILAVSIGLHEFGHAKAAELLGDFLPRRQGRVSLNPLRHLDPVGTGLIPLIMIFGPLLTHSRLLSVSLIGWGRPVRISLANPKTRRRDEILITLAGPGMNFLLALGTGLAGGLVNRIHGGEALWADRIIAVNCSLIAFNCIPLPPLDASRILRRVVAMSDQTFARLSLLSPLILLVLVNTAMVQAALIHVAGWAARPVYFCMYHVAGGQF
jgi:Zn-dependent protease